MAKMFHPQMLNRAAMMSRGHCPAGTASRSPPACAMVKSPTAPARRHSVRNRMGAISLTASFIIGQFAPHPSVRPIKSPTSCGERCVPPRSRA